MANPKPVATDDTPQSFERYTDSELLAFWAATEVVDEADITIVPEAALIDGAAQELTRRGLLAR